MSAFTVRPMASADIPQVFSIDQASSVLYWPERSYHFEVEKNENSRPFVAVNEEGEVIGFIVFWLILDEAELSNFAVSASCRRQGVGRALLLRGLRSCYEGGARTSQLEVRAGNVPARGLYEGCGYHTVGIRKKYYQDNHEDALLMDLETEDYEKLIGRTAL